MMEMDLNSWRDKQAKLWAANLLGPRADWTFESFPMKETDTYARVKTWATNSIVRHQSYGLLLYGKAGAGKTGLAVSAARARVDADAGSPYHWMTTANMGMKSAVDRGDARKRYAPIYFEWWADTVRKFRKAARSNGDDPETNPDENQLFAEIQERSDLFVFDDIDVGDPSGFREQLLLTLINQFVEGKRNIVLTMNRSPLDAVEYLGERIVDRIIGKDFLKVPFEGKSLRH